MATELDRLKEENRRLREEIARLRGALSKHGIQVEPEEQDCREVETVDWHCHSKPEPATVVSLEEKVALFRSLFRGREDGFARRWFSPTSGKGGYQPVCLREWNWEFCDKKKYKCAECPNQMFQELGYNDIYRHLEGKDTNCKDVVGLCAVIDQRVGWYGSVNLIGRSLSDSNVIRLDDANFATTLLDAMGIG